MSEDRQPGTHTETIHLPAPTAWPLILALGATLALAGLVTNAAIAILGGVLIIFGSVGWFRQVLPHEAHEDIPVIVEPITIQSSRRTVEKIVVPEGELAQAPVATYPIVSGIKGGLAGGIAMIPPALLYGLIAEHSIWYPINLLGGAGVAQWRNPSIADIAAFHWQGLMVATAIHFTTCVLVGLLYGAMLPMLPRRPVLLGGVVAPVLWTGLLHSTMGIVNPVLDEHIAWGWFLVSQVAFGIVAGLVVARDERIRASRSLPIAMRLGIETPGLMHERKEDDRP
jgi:hypothetical protein